MQYVPELFDYIKVYVDREKRPGDFWLTGSQTFHMMKKVTESLAGRAGIVRMLGLSNSEISGYHFPPFKVDLPVLMKRMDEVKPMRISDVYSRIFKGSMPRLYENEAVDPEQYYESYLETIQPYANNALKRVIKAPRMYFLDTGLCAHLTRWSSPETLERGAMDGQFFETWVVSEIYKSYINAGKQPPLYFYRDSNKKEIDLLIYQDGVLTPVEIKKGSAPKDAVKNFTVLSPIEKEPGAEDVFFRYSTLKNYNWKRRSHMHARRYDTD